MAGLRRRPDTRWELYGVVLPEEFDPARSLGWSIVSWIEHYLCHGPGDVQGEPLELDDDFVEFVVCAYALDEHGRRLFTEEFISRAKGTAKSELAGALVCCEFVGPARFDHYAEEDEVSPWGYAYAAGEPVGRRVVSPFIRCLATEEEQTGNTFDNVTFMLQRLSEEHGDEFPALSVGRTRVFLPETGGEIRPSTSGAASKDGGKETFIVADETHLYNSRELRAMYHTVKRNLGSKRKESEPHLLQTSTMYAPGEDSIAEATHAAHLEGKLRRVLFDHVQAPEVSLRNRRELVKALKVAYVGRPWIDYERIADDAQDPRVSPSDVYRYSLNRPTSPEDAWIAADPLNARRVPALAVEPGTVIVLGYDGGRTDDNSALIAVRVSDGYSWPLGVWEPEVSSGEIDSDKVSAAVAKAFDDYEVVLFYADPPYWQTEVGEWSVKYGAEIVREWWTQRSKPMHDALERLHTALVTGQITYGDDEKNTLTRHVLQARKWFKGGFQLVRKERPGSPKKIDALVAWTLAFEARGDAIAAGLGQPKKKARFRAAGFS